MSVSRPTPEKPHRPAHPPPEPPPPSKTAAGVLDRAIVVLDAIEAGARTYTDLVRVTGFTRPTTHRLLKSLEQHGFVAMLGSYGYVLGPRLLRLASAAMRDLPLRDLAHPALERLAGATGESAQLYVRDVDRRVCVDVAESNNELRTIVEAGASLPLFAGSAGKIFLAEITNPDELDRLLSEHRQLTEKTPDRERLERQIHAARRRGWASSSGEREPGVGSVSAPVRGPRGELIAVVSVSGPDTRIRRLAADQFAPVVLQAAAEIERALGTVG